MVEVVLIRGIEKFRLMCYLGTTLFHNILLINNSNFKAMSDRLQGKKFDDMQDDPTTKELNTFVQNLLKQM